PHPWRQRAERVPSHNNTHVVRSDQLVIEVSLSAPITRTVLYVCDVMNCCAISNPKIKPAHAAEMSRQAAFVAPIFFCTKQAVAGNNMSGVAVATKIRSRSSGLTFACS